MSRPDPAALFQNTQSDTQGQLPGKEPNNQDFARLASNSSVFFKIKNAQKYLNINSYGYAIISENPSTRYVLVPHNNKHYIVVANGAFKDYYLSYSRNYYVGVYKRWANARYWTFNDPIIDNFNYPGLYFHSLSGITYLCCNGEEDAPNELIDIIDTRYVYGNPK